MIPDKNPTATDQPSHSQEGPASVEDSSPDARRTEDLKLMQLAAQGNEQAKRAVAHRLVHRVRRLSKMMLLDEAMADDASQNALIEILRSAKTYRGQSSVERWADRITARTALRHKRDERRREQFATTQVDAELLEGASRDRARQESTPRPVEEYLHMLPETQREAIVLKHAFDYTTDEIAELTGVAIGTVKDRLVTARRQLRKLIQRDLTLNIKAGKP